MQGQVPSAFRSILARIRYQAFRSRPITRIWTFERIEDTLRAEASAIGFAKIGICRPSDITQAVCLRDFVAAGYHGQMGWLEGVSTGAPIKRFGPGKIRHHAG